MSLMVCLPNIEGTHTLSKLTKYYQKKKPRSEQKLDILSCVVFLLMKVVMWNAFMPLMVTPEKLNISTACLNLHTKSDHPLQCQYSIDSLSIIFQSAQIKGKASPPPPTSPTLPVIWNSSLCLSISLPHSRYFDMGSIWFKLTHFVSGNRSRETEEGETGKAAAALIPPTGSVKSAFHKGCSPLMSPPEWQIGPLVL